jgi:hypothetical protein
MLDGYASRAAAGDQTGADAYARRVDERLQHYHYHTPREWGELLSQAGLTLLETQYYMPERVHRFWDRMNGRYGIGRRRSIWTLLVSPRLSGLGYQPIMRRLVVRQLGTRWRPYYEMGVAPGAKGGGLLVVAQK